MKRLLLLTIVALIQFELIQAQTDVTQTYIQNPSFDESITYSTASTGTFSRWSSVADVTSWEDGGTTSGATYGTIEYGTAVTDHSGKSFPTQAPEGSTSTAALAMQSGWTSAIITQNEITLPEGFYTLSMLQLDLYLAGSSSTFTAQLTNSSGQDVATLTKTCTTNSQWQQLTTDITYLTEDTYSITITFYTNDGASVILVDDVALEQLDDSEVLPDLLSTLTDLTNYNFVNVGDATFQIPSTAATTLQTAIDKATTYTSDNTAVEVYNAINTLQEAFDTYAETELNAPQNNERFNIIMNVDGFKYDQNPLTYCYDDNYQGTGNYRLRWDKTANTNLAQAYTFNPTENTNKNTISYQDSVGTNHYICTCHTAYGTNTTSQIRTTEDPDLALNVKVVVSTEDEGVWYLLNTEANQYLGSNGDYGFANGDYTSLSLTTATRQQPH